MVTKIVQGLQSQILYSNVRFGRETRKGGKRRSRRRSRRRRKRKRKRKRKRRRRRSFRRRNERGVKGGGKWASFDEEDAKDGEEEEVAPS